MRTLESVLVELIEGLKNGTIVLDPKPMTTCFLCGNPFESGKGAVGLGDREFCSHACFADYAR